METSCWRMSPKVVGRSICERAVRAGDGESWSLSSDLKGAVLCREGRLLCVLKEDGIRANVNQSVVRMKKSKKSLWGGYRPTMYLFIKPEKREDMDRAFSSFFYAISSPTAF